MLRHNAKKEFPNQQFKIVYRWNGVKREHYHGGKINGGNCIRIMEMAKKLLLGDVGAEGEMYVPAPGLEKPNFTLF